MPFSTAANSDNDQHYTKHSSGRDLPLQEADLLQERIILPEHILLGVISSHDLKVQVVLDRYILSTPPDF